MMDDFTYEALKGCYEIASSISASLIILIIICGFLVAWLIVLLFKLQKERRLFGRMQNNYVEQILELTEKNGKSKIRK